MNYYEFNLKVSIIANSEENAEELINLALTSNDIDVKNLQCEYEEIYS